MEVLASNGVVVSLSSVEIGRSKAHIQMSYHFANPRMEEGMSIYSSSHEGVSEGQKGTWASAESVRAGRPEVPGMAGRSGRRRFWAKVRAGSRLSRELAHSWKASVRQGRKLRDGRRFRGPEVLGSGRKFRAFQKLVQASSSFSSTLPSRMV